MLRPLFTAAGILAASPAFAASPQLVPLHPPQLWQRAEFRVPDAPTAANNFDPDQIRADATIATPSGATLAVPAFWFQDYSAALVAGEEQLTPRGAPEWRLRFTPTEPGAYTISLAFALNNAAPSATATLRFTVTPAALPRQHGWVRVADDHRYFETTDGRALRLIGENVCWPQRRGTFDYEDWFAAMHRSGQNFARLWMAPWWAGLEHAPGTLNHYKLDAAWQLDRIFDLAAADGIYLLFCFDHHGMYMANDPAWGGSNNFWLRSNPYARENGGPCASPDEFFTSPAARKIYEKRLRYLVARYGASPQLLAWQFFNEIDNAYIPRSNLAAADVAAWHADVGGWLHAHDPFHHLVTTSLTGGSDRPEIWSLPELDFSAYHSYWDPAPGRKAATLSADFVARYHKPVMIAEFGVSAANWARPLDPHLRGFRQSLWSAALGGSVGTSMSWWWEDIDADRAYTIYGAMREILDRAGWNEGSWRPADVSTPGLPPAELGEPISDGAVFSAPLALNSFRRIQLSGEAAIANPLAAERSSEFLTSYLRGAAQANQQRPLRIVAWFADNAHLVFSVDSIANDAEIVVRLDGAESLREHFAAPEPPSPGQGHKIDREFSVAIPAGRHRIEIANTGADWLTLGTLRLSGVRPSELAGGWRFAPEAVALRTQDKAALYLCSQWIVFPAGAHRYHGPLLTGQAVTLRDWPAGRFRAEWFDPQTAQPVATTAATSDGGVLTIPVPDFSEDLSAVISRAP